MEKIPSRRDDDPLNSKFLSSLEILNLKKTQNQKLIVFCTFQSKDLNPLCVETSCFNLSVYTLRVDLVLVMAYLQYKPCLILSAVVIHSLHLLIVSVLG